MLDKLKNLGFKYSTLSGISIAITDIKESEKKPKIIEHCNKLVDDVNKQFKRGLITDRERYLKIVEIWSKAKNDISAELAEMLEQDKENSISMMIDSKARGDIGSLTKLAGMRGLFSKPDGSQMEIPVISSFNEGISIS